MARLARPGLPPALSVRTARENGGQAGVRFRTEPTVNEVANKLEELAIQLRFSTEPATRLEIARVLVHLAGHTFALAGARPGGDDCDLPLPAIKLAAE